MVAVAAPQPVILGRARRIFRAPPTEEPLPFEEPVKLPRLGDLIPIGLKPGPVKPESAPVIRLRPLIVTGTGKLLRWTATAPPAPPPVRRPRPPRPVEPLPAAPPSRPPVPVREIPPPVPEPEPEAFLRAPSAPVVSPLDLDLITGVTADDLLMLLAMAVMW